MAVAVRHLADRLDDRPRVDPLVDVERDGRDLEAGALGLAGPDELRVEVRIVRVRLACAASRVGLRRDQADGRVVDPLLVVVLVLLDRLLAAAWDGFLPVPVAALLAGAFFPCCFFEPVADFFPFNAPLVELEEIYREAVAYAPAVPCTRLPLRGIRGSRMAKRGDAAPPRRHRATGVLPVRMKAIAGLSPPTG